MTRESVKDAESFGTVVRVSLVYSSLVLYTDIIIKVKIF